MGETADRSLPFRRGCRRHHTVPERSAADGCSVGCVDQWRRAAVAFDYDVMVVGSGFGGSVAALRLTEKGYRVGVLEAGKRWDASSLPTTNWNVRKSLWFPKLGMRGIQRLSLLDHALALSGAGVGGGSLVWGNVCYEPHGVALRDPQWGHITDWEDELAPHFDQARRMLGVQTIPAESTSDGVLRSVAAHFGVEDTFTLPPVAVHFGKKGVEEPDPYFGGEGPTRTGCIECGGCMVGCRYNAKNTLDLNYLPRRAQRGDHPSGTPGGGRRSPPGRRLSGRHRTTGGLSQEKKEIVHRQPGRLRRQGARHRPSAQPDEGPGKTPEAVAASRPPSPHQLGGAGGSDRPG